jgi:uridine kinase
MARHATRRGTAVTLATDPTVTAWLLQGLTAEERSRFQAFTELREVPAGATVVTEDDADRDMYIILAGSATLHRHGQDLRPLGPGDAFGDLALVTDHTHRASAIAHTPLLLIRLSAARYRELSERYPAIALKVTQAIITQVGDQLMTMSDDIGLMLHERSQRRRREVTVWIGSKQRRVPTGTALANLLPDEVDGSPVVAGLLNHKPVALQTVITADALLEPLTTAHWEGERVYRRSVRLLLLEAANQVCPHLKLVLGPSMGAVQEVQVFGDCPDPAALADELNQAMAALVAQDIPFRQEWWSVDAAINEFQTWGWTAAAKLLKVWRYANVMLVSCGQVYAISMSPLVPRSGLLTHFQLVPDRSGLKLSIDRSKVDCPTVLDAHDEVRDRAGETMVREHRRWLTNLDVTSVGAFNEHCITGEVSQLIRIAEGFHEKRIGQIADAIVDRGGQIRVISMAGPSGSGKTTFIKRLSVQLQINGINPVGISLDDYYIDREHTPRDEAGEYDFEAFEALNVALLQDQLARLLRGETVRLARYDFISGRSLPEGGRELRLQPDEVLMLEGIHGLNPDLIGELLAAEGVFRIFINPMTALSFDHLNQFSVSDLRLLRRIVRDRYSRGASAADNILRWPSVRAGERLHIFPMLQFADAVFDSSLVYEPSVIKVYAERYLLEVPQDHPAFLTAYRLRQLIDRFVTIYPDHVPSTSILREFIGDSGFQY